MKTVIVLILAFSLTGCFYQNVTSNDWRKAQIACEKHEGVDRVKSDFLGSVFVRCNNGERLNVTDKVQP